MCHPHITANQVVEVPKPSRKLCGWWGSFAPLDLEGRAITATQSTSDCQQEYRSLVLQVVFFETGGFPMDSAGRTNEPILAEHGHANGRFRWVEFYVEAGDADGHYHIRLAGASPSRDC